MAELQDMPAAETDAPLVVKVKPPARILKQVLAKRSETKRAARREREPPLLDQAPQRYAEAVSVAAEACAEDTKGQTCYICTEAVHWKTKEGLVRGCSCHGGDGFVHVSCLAEQAKILVAEAEENKQPRDPKWVRWHTCSLCKQHHHGVVLHALGWACWKTYVGRPETNWARLSAMTLLGAGLSAADQDEDALSVEEAELAMKRRLGYSEDTILVVQGNLACTYVELGRKEEALQMRRDVYSGRLRLQGEEDPKTLLAANNYALSLIINLQRFEEAKALLRKTIPVARRVLGENHYLILRMRWAYARALDKDPGATLDDLREAVTTLEDAGRIARRVLGGAHPLTEAIELALRNARAALNARQE